MSILVMQMVDNAILAEKRARREREQPRRITSIHAEGDGINICFHTGDTVIIELWDWCNWYNEVSKDNRTFRPITPEDITDLSLDAEDVLLYLRWELGLFGAFLPIEEEVFRNEDYPD